MMRYVTNWLAALLVAGLACACDPGEDNDGPASDAAGRGDGAGLDFGFDQGGSDTSGPDFGTPDSTTTGNLACHLELDNLDDQACLTCMQSSCSSELVDALGVADVPTEPGGACVGLLSCLDGCDCEDGECALGCFANVTEACSEANVATEACGSEFCEEPCADDPGPTNGYCSDPDETLSAGTSTTGELAGGDRSESPRGGVYDVYALASATGDLVISLESGVFDTYLYAYDDGCSQIASDDDGGSGTNSQLTVSGSDAAWIVVTGFSSGEMGTYTLSVSAAEP